MGDQFKNILQKTLLENGKPRVFSRVGVYSAMLSFSCVAHSTSLSHFTARGVASAPSYLVSQSDQFIAKNTVGNRVNLFTIRNGAVVKASVETVINGRRVMGDFVLEGKKYRLSRFVRTNQFRFNSDKLSDLYIDEKCSLKDNKLEDIAKVVTSSEYAARYLDSSCTDLPKFNQLVLLKTRDYLNPTDVSYINLQKCLKGLYTSASDKDERLKSAILNMQAGLVATAEREESNPRFKLFCEESKTEVAQRAAKTDPATGKISFIRSEGRLTVDREKIAKVFIHELVHYTKQTTLTKGEEEALAEYISESCTGNSMAKAPQLEGSREIVGITSSMKTTAAEIAPKATLDIKDAVEAIPVQQIQVADLNAVSSVGDNQRNSPRGSNHASNVYDSVLSSANSHFSTALRVIDKSIPVAQASGRDTVSRSFDISSKIRVPASESPRNLRAPASSSPGLPSAGERLVEEILISSKDGKKLVRTVIEHTDEGSSELAGPSTPTSSVAGSRPTYSGGEDFSQSVASAATGQSRSSNVRVIASVGGVEFNSGLISGQAYQRYTSQIVSESFRSQLENAGILISKQGKLVTRPKKMAASYFDDGKSLVYGDF